MPEKYCKLALSQLIMTISLFHTWDMCFNSMLLNCTDLKWYTLFYQEHYTRLGTINPNFQMYVFCNNHHPMHRLNRFLSGKGMLKALGSMFFARTLIVIRVVEEWADQTGGGGWKTLCIRRGYSEPRGAESREGSSTLAESSRVT